MQRQERRSSQGHDGDSQVRRPGGDRGPECERHDAEPPAGAGPGRWPGSPASSPSWPASAGGTARNSWRPAGGSPPPGSARSAGTETTLSPLSDRRWVCPNCGAENERDLNAAINLERAGLELPGAGRGDRVRPATPAMAVEASRESMRDIRTPAKLEYQVSSDSQ